MTALLLLSSSSSLGVLARLQEIDPNYEIPDSIPRWPDSISMPPDSESPGEAYEVVEATQLNLSEVTAGRLGARFIAPPAVNEIVNDNEENDLIADITRLQQEQHQLASGAATAKAARINQLRADKAALMSSQVVVPAVRR